MNKLNTIAIGGHPIELDDLRWMDESYRNAFFGILSAFGISPAETFVLSGCVKTITGSTVTVTEGYLSIAGEVLFLPAQSYAVPSGVDEDYFELDISYDPTGLETFENGTPHNTYEIRNAKISVGTPTTGTVTLVSGVKTIFEVIEANIPAIAAIVLELLVNSTEALLGRIKLATQLQTDSGIDDSRAITPLKLKNTNYLPKILNTATIYVGTITAALPAAVAITFPSVATANYRVVGYLYTSAGHLGQVVYAISGHTTTGFDVIIQNLNPSAPISAAYFFYTIYKNH